jgi:hypothetical protein
VNGEEVAERFDRLRDGELRVDASRSTRLTSCGTLYSCVGDFNA